MKQLISVHEREEENDEEVQFLWSTDMDITFIAQKDKRVMEGANSIQDRNNWITLLIDICKHANAKPAKNPE